MSKESFRIVFLGAAGVGKTSLIKKIKGEQLEINEPPTIQLSESYKMTTEYNNQKYDLVLWDTAGQEQYRSIAKNYYRNCSVAVLVFSIISKDTFNEMVSYINEMETNLGVMPRVIVVGNKIDIEEWRDIVKQEVDSYCTQNKFPYVETSAVNGEGIPILLEMITTECAQNMAENKQDPIEGAIKINHENGKKGGCAC